MSIANAKKRLNLIAILGGISFLIAWVTYLSGRLIVNQLELLFFFGVAVTTPWAMRLIVQQERNGQNSAIYQKVIWLLPIAITCVAIALLTESRLLAVGLASIWQIETLLLAFYGLKRLLQRPSIAIEEVCVDFGLIYMPIGAFWLMAYLLEYALLTFDSAFVLLTAVHFTFISPGALVIMGMVGRQLFVSPSWAIYRRIAWVAVLSPALVAVGITVTQYAGSLWLEAGSVVMLAGSFLLLAIISFTQAFQYHRLARLLIMVSISALVVTMGFALAYSIGRLTNWWTLSLTQMVQWHGWLNAVGFTLCGLLAWNMIEPVAHITLPGIPFSRIPWQWHMGPDFFHKIDAINSQTSSPPTGIVDNLQDYERIDFKAQSIDPRIIAFYEYTANHELLVYPDWQPGFRFLARIYKLVSKRIGQMNFPLAPETNETHISSRIVPIKDALDGREKVRGWVRTYTQTNEAVYVAAYSSHCYQQCRYMNIAFPLPFGNLTSILRLEELEPPGNVLLTSLSQRGEDQGVYFANRLFDIRLPINETISVYTSDFIYEGFPSGFGVGEVLAEHKMWLFGIHCLTLHYSIKPLSDSQSATT